MIRNNHSLHTDDNDDAQASTTSNSLRVLIADDHNLVRETIALFLESEGITGVATVKSVDQAIEEANRSGSFDLVLLDYNMPGMNGLAGLARMIDANAGRPVALISGDATPAIVNDAISAGAAGFVPKTLGARSMISAIRFMAAGEVFVPFGFLQQAPADAIVGLSDRESQVLRGLCEGKYNKEIARDLGLQEVTVKLHVKTLCRKLDAKNRTQAAMIAKDRNLV